MYNPLPYRSSPSRDSLRQSGGASDSSYNYRSRSDSLRNYETSISTDPVTSPRQRSNAVSGRSYGPNLGDRRQETIRGRANGVSGERPFLNQVGAAYGAQTSVRAPSSESSSRDAQPSQLQQLKRRVLSPDLENRPAAQPLKLAPIYQGEDRQVGWRVPAIFNNRQQFKNKTPDEIVQAYPQVPALAQQVRSDAVRTRYLDSYEQKASTFQYNNNRVVNSINDRVYSGNGIKNLYAMDLQGKIVVPTEAWSNGRKVGEKQIVQVAPRADGNGNIAQSVHHSTPLGKTPFSILSAFASLVDTASSWW
jgi:hypothetical protein